MKAVLRTNYGPPEKLQLAEVEMPVPKDHQVVVQVHAASINASDWRGFTMPGDLAPTLRGRAVPTHRPPARR
jgi:NADPH:quinone reductase-like Zn-dependent oxidoreductase